MSLQRILILVALLLVVTILIVAASRSQKTGPPAQQNAKVVNNTKGLQVISAVHNGGELYIAFRNDYEKNVMAYVISISNSQSREQYTEEFAYSGFVDAGIPPHSTYEKRIPFVESNERINIEAVFLDGGSADGNAAVIQDTKDDRLAARIQIERTLKLLDNHLKLPGPKTNAEMGKLKSEIVSELEAPEADSLAALKQLEPARYGNSLSEHTRNALGEGKQRVLGEFHDVEAAQDAREELLKLKEHYGRVLRRL